jgi:hypothetical protein
LCDGTGPDGDGYPGIAVPSTLASLGLTFTGADDIFYANTSCKIKLKRLLQGSGVDTSAFVQIRRETLMVRLDLPTSSNDRPHSPNIRLLLLLLG